MGTHFKTIQNPTPHQNFPLSLACSDDAFEKSYISHKVYVLPILSVQLSSIKYIPTAVQASPLPTHRTLFILQN